MRRDQDIEAMFMALKLGAHHLDQIRLSARPELSTDLERVSQLTTEAANLLGRHIKPHDLSILHR